MTVTEALALAERKMKIGRPGRSGYPVEWNGETRVHARVSTILGLWPKPFLVPWAAKEERALLKAATWELLQTVKTPEAVSDFETWSDLVEKFAGDKKAHRKKLVEAGDVGTLAHERIQHATRLALGEESSFDPPACACKAGGPPCRACASLVAFMSWEDWTRAVEWKPVACEFPVCSWGEYAGTVDALGSAVVEGERSLLLVDYKTGARIYPEATVQVAAYRAALMRTMESALPREVVEATGRTYSPSSTRPRLAIVRLPKSLNDPAFEARIISEESAANALAAFRAAMAFRNCLATLEGGSADGTEE